MATKSMSSVFRNEKRFYFRKMSHLYMQDEGFLRATFTDGAHRLGHGGVLVHTRATGIVKQFCREMV